MISNVIFIDTSFFKALIDIKDEFHSKAVRIWKEIENSKLPTVTSNFILDETYTMVRFRCSRFISYKIKSFLIQNSDRVRILRVAIKDEKSGWVWFEKDWSKLSFTDCVTFAQMKRLGITQVATFDKHFEKAGFEIVK